MLLSASKRVKERERWERSKNRISEIYASEIIIKIFASSPSNVGFLFFLHFSSSFYVEFFNESGMNKNNVRKFSEEENNKFYWGIFPSLRLLLPLARIWIIMYINGMDAFDGKRTKKMYQITIKIKFGPKTLPSFWECRKCFVRGWYTPLMS